MNLGQRFCFFVVKFKFFLFFSFRHKNSMTKKLNANSNDEMRSLMGNGDFFCFMVDKQFSHMIPTMRHFVLFLGLGNCETNVFWVGESVCM